MGRDSSEEIRGKITMHWLVTGGCGFIGRNLIIKLLEKGHRVTSIDVRGDEFGSARARIAELVGVPQFRLMSIEKMDRLYVIDWRIGHVPVPSLERVFEGYKRGDGSAVDVVVHLAAVSGLAACAKEPERSFAINVKGTYDLLTAAHEVGVPRFLFASSGAVLAGENRENLRKDEDAPLAPSGIYGSQKAAAEMLCQGYAEERGLSVALFRLSNVFGPYSEEKGSVVNRFVRQAVDGEPITIHGDGSQKRDFVYVDDVVDAIIDLGWHDNEETRKAPTGIFHVSSGRPRSVHENARYLSAPLSVVASIKGAVETDLQLERDESVSPGVAFSSLDPQRLRGALGWSSATSFVRGVEKTVEWYRRYKADGGVR
jgi:UDP-glucose 4-epimerase